MSSFVNDAISSDFTLETQTVQRLCVEIDTPRSLLVWLLIEYKEWSQIVDLNIDSSVYEDHSNFADDYLVTEILKKSPNLPLGIDRRGRALESFINSELKCWFTNMRFDEEEKPEWVPRFERNLDLILGPCNSRALQKIEERSRFGPGASTGVRGVGSASSDKFDKPLHMTADLYPFFRSIIGDLWWEHQTSCKEIVPGNKFTTVPKNAKTDRGICVEPTLNMYVQLGLGSYLRSRLKRFGIDLNTQLRNQELAARAYDDGLATIDLSQASDSLAWGLVLHFVPERWMELLFLLRSKSTTLPDGEVIDLGKLSSMGNGFTFELESLIFFALVKTIVPQHLLDDCTVYGDDIIVPKAHADSVIDALNYLGFSVNGSKSFLAGNFFESCGADYFRGVNVRPFYLRGRKDHIPYALQIANSLRKYANRRGGREYCDSRWKPIWLSLLRKVPKTWRDCRVPDSFGDCGVIVAESELLRREKPKGDHQGVIVHFVAMRPKSFVTQSYGLMLSILARNAGLVGPSWEDIPGPPQPPRVAFTYGRQPLRGLFGKTRTKRTTVFQWCDGWDWA